MTVSSYWTGAILPLPRLPQPTCLSSLVWPAKMSWERTRRMKPTTTSTTMMASPQTVRVTAGYWVISLCNGKCLIGVVTKPSPLKHLTNTPVEIKPVPDMSQHLAVFLFSRWWCSVWDGHLTDWNLTSKSKWPGITRASGLACRNQCCEPSWQPSSLALCLAAGCNVCKPWGFSVSYIQVQCGQLWKLGLFV